METGNPLNGLLRSRKFLVLLVNTVVSVVLYFGGKYLAPGLADDLVFLVGAMQVVALAVIAGIAYEDGQAKQAGLHPSQQPEIHGMQEPPDVP